MLLPGGDRIGLVEPRADRDGLPQPVHVRLAEDLGRPAFVRARDPGPVHGAVDHLLADDVVQFEHARPTDALAVEIGEQVRFGVARCPDHRVAAHVPEALLQPFRGVLERLVGAMLDQRPPDVLVGVLHVDVARTGRVPRACERPDQRRMLDRAEQEECLARLEICADADCQFGVPV